jgi:Maltokinase N-terminal cap domain
MATIHRTTMVPTKLELLSEWLPRQPWYRSTDGAPALTRAGGFRLDDPAGEVGIEFAFVLDGAEVTYQVPMTYRGAPLPDAEEGLIGTSEHGVLGRRWIYDAAHDPVAVRQLLAFLAGEAQAQAQNDSDTPDSSVGRSWIAGGRPVAPTPLSVATTEPGRTTIAVTGPSSEQLALDLIRVLQPGPLAEAALGHVDADWTRPGGAVARGAVVVVRER